MIEKNNNTILLVEDDPSLGLTLKEQLEKNGYKVYLVDTGSLALAQVKQNNFQLIILDIGLPDCSGLDLAVQIKTVYSGPFIFLTAQFSPEERLLGFERGAIEFIPKPFHLKEVLIRIAHVLEHHGKNERRFHQIKIKNVVFDFDSFQVRSQIPGIAIELSTRDIQVLKLLIERSPHVLSRDMILDEIWGKEQFPSHRTVDNTVVRLRHVLNDQKGELIHSVRRIGYQWLGNNLQ